MLSLFFHASQKELKMTKFLRKFLEMQNKKIDLIKDDITAKLFEELIRSKWEIEVMGKKSILYDISAFQTFVTW